jgi:tRNA threonylcarbamoyl adenosine modification protein YeaZ
MLILALETATRSGSVALLDEDVGLSEGRPGDASRTHGERLPAELLDLLAAHGRALQDVDRFAVVSGPGSFTGLRVGIASIQGLAMATGRRVQPVTTLEAMVDSWLATAGRRAPDGHARMLVACLDGQRGDLFYEAWRAHGNQPIEDASTLIPAAVGRPADLLAAIRAQQMSDPLVVVGCGVGAHAPVFESLGTSIEVPSDPLALAAARIAARRGDPGVAPHALRPIYIRRPDAVLARERAELSARDGRP